jgi:hypothetical protein
MTYIYPIALIGALVATAASICAGLIFVGGLLLRRDVDETDEDARIW